MEKAEKPVVIEKFNEMVNSNSSSQIHNSLVRRLTKPKSAGNAGFKRHNKRQFMKTERLRKLNKK